MWRLRSVGLGARWYIRWIEVVIGIERWRFREQCVRINLAVAFGNLALFRRPAFALRSRSHRVE
eukprot:1156601-Pleurochrysis_carterae.AAC.1